MTKRLTYLARLVDYSNPKSLASRFRRRRFVHIESLVRKVLAVRESCTIIDVGGTAMYWKLMDPGLLEKCRVTIVNLATAKGLDPKQDIPPVGEFRFDLGDGRELDFKDKSFDIAHSNSVIEHVGVLADMRRFAREIVRLSHYYYVQTPNMWFPVDPHYGVPLFHWLPLPLRARLLATMDIGLQKKRATLQEAVNYVEFVNLLDCNMLKDLFPQAEIRRERFLFMAKSLMALGEH